MRGIRVAVIAVFVCVLAACDSGTVDRVNDARATAGVAELPTSQSLADSATAHSQAMCDAGIVTASPDPAEEYDAETAAAVDELVGRAPLDASITNANERIRSAGAEVWESWADDPTVVDPGWDDIGVGHVECDDGQLYLTAVLRRLPTVPTTGRYAGRIYEESQVTVVNGLTYGTAVDYTGATVSLQLDLYLPPADVAARPTVVLVHGGGFVSGTRANMASTAREYARRGYVAASISYRLNPNLSSDASLLIPTAFNAIDDGMESIRWLKANAATYGIDTSRIAMLGSSAGGGIALGVGEAEDATPTGPLSSYSPDVAAVVSTGAALTPGLSLLEFTEDDSPALMFHFETDTVTGWTATYAAETCAAIRQPGNTCDFSVQAGSGHTVSLSPTSGYWTSSTGPFLWHHLRLGT